MTHDPVVHDLMARLRDGDGSAAEDCFNRFSRRLIGLAYTRLGAQMRQKTDPEDIVQSVFRSFFVKAADSAYEIDTWGGLWRMLVVITLRKCGRRVEYFRAERRNIERERSPAGSEGNEQTDWAAIATDPSPVDAAILAETVQLLLEPLNPRDREIVSLRLQGFEIAEISQKTDRSERTVFRILERTRELLVGLQSAD